LSLTKQALIGFAYHFLYAQHYFKDNSHEILKLIYDNYGDNIITCWTGNDEILAFYWLPAWGVTLQASSCHAE
jgi:hypothetical protein